MVGGIVVEVIVFPEHVWVNVRETQGNSRTECALNLQGTPESKQIRPGDALWWQGDKAMWTPRFFLSPKPDAPTAVRPGLCQGQDWDIALPRYGGSGAARPTDEEIEAAGRRFV